MDEKKPLKELNISVKSKTKKDAQAKKKPQVKVKKPLLKVLTQALRDIMKMPISRWITVGASLRYFGQFASDYYVPMFYLTTYP